MTFLAFVLALFSPGLLLLAIGRLVLKRERNFSGNIGSVPAGEAFPLVSLLVPVRNEEANIVTCLESICRLSYPRHRLEVLVGNDHSEDQTRQLVAAFIHDKPWFQLVDIGENRGFAQGKSNALAYLTRQARGEYFLFTDADIVLPKNWVESMLAGFSQPHTGVVTGFTVISGQSLFSKLQSIDWLYSWGIVSLISELGMPAATLGNNMAVMRQAYFATDGYENMPFSITEDHQLFKAIVDQGYSFKQFIEPQVTALTMPMPTFHHWLQQRKRWMQAAAQSIWPVHAFIFLQIIFYPLLGILYAFDPVLAIGIFVSRVLVQAIYIEVLSLRVQRRRMGWQVLLFEFHTIVLTTILLLYCLLPTKIRWKGREYGQ